MLRTDYCIWRIYHKQYQPTCIAHFLVFSPKGIKLLCEQKQTLLDLHIALDLAWK